MPEYEEKKIPPGGDFTRSIGSGETLENLLIDATADGATIRIKANGRGWTIRNVGVKGHIYDPGGWAAFALVARGDCTVENVYMGDGASPYGGASGSGTAFWADPSAPGTITYRSVYVAGWPDNGIYSNTLSGRTVIDACYAEDCNHAEFRAEGNGNVVKNSVVANGADRGVWARRGDTTIKNCDITMQSGEVAVWAGKSGARGDATLIDTEYQGKLHPKNGTIDLQSGNGQNPRPEPPNGVPMNAEMAAKGEGYDGSRANEPPEEEPPGQGGIAEAIGGPGMFGLALGAGMASAVAYEKYKDDLPEFPDPDLPDVDVDV